MRTFTVAGVSTEDGVLKFRVANDLEGRIAMLERCGNVNINLVALPNPMTKEEAAAHLLESPFCTPDVRALLAAVAAKEATVVRKPRAEKTPRVKVAKTVAKPEADVVDDDGFVEPKDERIQVAMSRLARQYKGLGARQLYEMVMLTQKEFGDTEPNF